MHRCFKRKWDERGQVCNFYDSASVNPVDPRYIQGRKNIYQRRKNGSAGVARSNLFGLLSTLFTHVAYYTLKYGKKKELT